MSLNNKRTTESDAGDIPWEAMHCPLSPSIKRQKVGGYSSGGSWHEGRVELKFDHDVVDDQSRRLMKEVILQAFERLNQTIIGEGLFHRPYTQYVACQETHTSNCDLSNLEYFGQDGDASCGRIGSVIPILLGYAVYGRVDNIQVLVQEPGMFTQVMDDLVDRKVSLLRQATLSLGALELYRIETLKETKEVFRTKLNEFDDLHRDALVAVICECPATAPGKLSEWESQRQEKSLFFENEYQKNVMNIEHECHLKKGKALQSCFI